MSIYDMADTWNNGAIDWDAIKIDVADSGSSANSRLLNLRLNGVEKFAVRKDGSVSIGADIALKSTGTIRWSASSDPFASSDIAFARDGIGMFAQRSGTMAQSYHLYNTYTNTTNWERAGFTWDAHKLHIGTYASGTGVARDIGIYRGGLQKISLGGNGAITMHGAVYPSANQAYYLGYASLRWQTIYGQHLDCTGNITFANLPATDPAVAGRLWNDAGVVKVSAG